MSIDVTPTPGQAMRYTVTATVVWTVPGVPLPKLRKYHTSSPKYAQIDMAPAGNKPTTITASNTADDPTPQTFSPVVTTELLSQAVDVGESMDDQVVAGLAEGSGPWSRDDAGNYSPVIASGTWYAMPTSSPPSAQPPSDASVIARETVTLSGPGTYNVVGPLAHQPGAYTVVWTIDARDQTKSTIDHLADAYSWSDAFRESDETGVVRSKVEVTTDVTATEVGLGVPAADTVTPVLGAGTAGWPVDLDGAPVAIPLFGTEYWVPGRDPLQQSALPPANAVPVASTVVSISSVAPIEGPSSAPTEASDGYLVWQWSTPQSDYVDAWTEPFAEPTQVIRVTAPTIVSVAEETVALTDPASDTVSVLGPDFAVPLELRWDAYLQQAGAAPTCNQSTLAFDSASEPIQVVKPGTYRVPSSPTFPKPGRYFWVATLSTKADGTVVAEGECGDPSEVTAVQTFSLATSAVAVSNDAGAISDSAIISGPTPSGATVKFRAYRQDDGSDICDASRLAYTSPSISVAKAGTYKSGQVKLPAANYDWVATAYDRDGNELQTGACGDGSEKSTVVSTLAHTGDQVDFIWVWTGGISVSLGAVLLLLIRPRASRRSTARKGH